MIVSLAPKFPTITKIGGVDWLLEFQVEPDIEAYICDRLRKLSSTSHWYLYGYYKTSNGGFFIAPLEVEQMLVVSPNGSEESVSPQAAGIVATIFVMSDLRKLKQSELNDIASFDFDPRAQMARLYDVATTTMASTEGQKIVALID